MDNDSRTILGVSLGTRILGLAVSRCNEIIDTKVSVFKGKVSNRKLLVIVDSLKDVIEKFNVSAIVLKLPDISRRSLHLEQLSKHVLDLAKHSSLQVNFFTLADIKFFCSQTQKFSRLQLMGYVVERVPMLFFEYEKELASKNEYYLKMFEAVILTRIIQP